MIISLKHVIDEVHGAVFESRLEVRKKVINLKTAAIMFDLQWYTLWLHHSAVLIIEYLFFLTRSPVLVGDEAADFADGAHSEARRLGGHCLQFLPSGSLEGRGRCIKPVTLHLGGDLPPHTLSSGERQPLLSLSSLDGVY